MKITVGELKRIVREEAAKKRARRRKSVEEAETPWDKSKLANKVDWVKALRLQEARLAARLVEVRRMLREAHVEEHGDR